MDIVTYGAAVKKAKAMIDEIAIQGIPTASAEILGGVRVGSGLSVLPDGTLSVRTAQVAEENNTLPITSAAVHAEIGNINALLETI